MCAHTQSCERFFGSVYKLCTHGAVREGWRVGCFTAWFLRVCVCVRVWVGFLLFFFFNTFYQLTHSAYWQLCSDTCLLWDLPINHKSGQLQNAKWRQASLYYALCYRAFSTVTERYDNNELSSTNHILKAAEKLSDTCEIWLYEVWRQMFWSWLFVTLEALIISFIVKKKLLEGSSSLGRCLMYKWRCP